MNSNKNVINFFDKNIYLCLALSMCGILKTAKYRKEKVMGNEAGEWIIHGVTWDDPKCIHDVDEAVEYINRVGFLPLFKNEIPGFSLEERTVAEYWWSDDPVRDPWRWRIAIAKKHDILFHTDAVQAYGQIPLDVNAMNIDMLSSSGHKLNGPKGIGFLYIRSGIKLGSFIHGGQQERGRRAGTENVPGIVGMGKAAELAMLSMEDRMKQETDIRDHMIHRILSEIPYSRLNGHDKDRLPNNVNVSFQFVEGETILIMLDMAGICASAGSACTSGSVDPSHVLTAIGLPKEISHGAVRLTLGYENTMDEADAVVDNLKRIVENLRKMSPAYQDFARRNM